MSQTDMYEILTLELKAVVALLSKLSLSFNSIGMAIEFKISTAFADAT